MLKDIRLESFVREAFVQRPWSFVQDLRRDEIRGWWWWWQPESPWDI